MANCPIIDNDTKNTPKEESKTRNWNKLDHNILIQIFQNLNINQLFDNVSLVCRSWEIACWGVLFWQRQCSLLDLQSLFGFSRRLLGSPMDNPKMEMRGMRLVKSIIEGDKDYATPLNAWTRSLRYLILPDNFHLTDRLLLYIAERTPEMISILFSKSQIITATGFSKAIGYWKQVKFVLLGPIDGGCHADMLSEMGKNWKMLQDLHIHINNFMVDGENALAIAKNIPRLNSLALFRCCVSKAGIKIIVELCKELENVKIEHCLLLEQKPSSTDNSTGGSWPMRKARPKDFQQWRNTRVQFRICWIL